MTRRPKFDEDGQMIAPAYFFREPLIACQGGPMAHQWLFASDWKKAREAHLRMRAAGQRSYGAADYVLTRNLVEHRQFAGVTAQVAVVG